MDKKILILTGGPVKKLESFRQPANDLGLDVTLASFYDIEFFLIGNTNFSLRVQGQDISQFDLIYFRMVGKRMEDATLVVNYAKENGIKVIDRVYESSLLIPSTISKAVEMKKLIQAEISLPPTYLGSLTMIGKNASDLLGYPYVVKSTIGKKAKDAWLIKENREFGEKYKELREREKGGVRFFAQKFIKASQRIRVLVVGNKVLGAITRPSKWRKYVVDARDDGKKEGLKFVPEKYSKLALEAANAVELDIAGIDILEEDKSAMLYVIEANAAPSWNLIKKNCGVDVEKEILKFLIAVS